MHGGDSSLLDRSFRAGSDFELVVFDRLAAQEQLVLAELRDDPSFYGVLRPREGSNRTFRAVDRDTALLWFSAQQPGRLPFFAWEAGGDHSAAGRRIAQLVLDGVLEIEHDGQFVSGARALHALPTGATGSGSGRIHTLSMDALRYGERLGLDVPEELVSCLYGFGAVPLSPRWTRQLVDSKAVLDYLGVSPGTKVHRRLAAHFSQSPESDGAHWISWARPNSRATRADDTTYKMYVSPHPDDLPNTFEALVEVLVEQEHLQFKIGGSAAGILRADKLVVYFESEESLQRAADVLTSHLPSVRAQGVPFSSEIALDGLLSWGIDPPRSARVLSWMGHDSWRVWIVRRLATAMVAAQQDAGAVAPSEYALERLRLDGIDVDGWIPPGGKWWLS